MDQLELGRINNQLLSLLDEATFTTAFTEGLEMSEEDIIKQYENLVPKIQNR